MLLEEIDYWQQKNNDKPFNYKEPVDYLVLLVGYSFEPLMQSIWYYRPQYILPVISKLYGKETDGFDMYNHFKDSIELLCKSDNFTHKPKLEFTDTSSFIESKPEAVFQYLVKEIIPVLKTDSNKRVIIDITGAKKSMVAGAYLFGAYADIPISYVDFEEYDELFGRPYGYSCDIKRLNNPYRAFSLHGWRRVRDLYNGYAFQAARQELAEITQSMTVTMSDEDEENNVTAIFSDKQIEAVSQLKFMLRMYELWEKGDFFGAREVYQELKVSGISIKIPTAVDVLAGIWPSYRGSGVIASNSELYMSKTNKKYRQLYERVLALEIGSTNESLYLLKQAFINYIYDESAKIKRLIDDRGDYRSAFQRVAGLTDTLFKARLMILWNTDALTVELLDTNSPLKTIGYTRSQLVSFDVKKSIKIDKKLATYSNTRKVKDLLYNNKPIDISESYKSPVEYFKFKKCIDGIHSQLQQFKKYNSVFFDTFSDLRNKAVHFTILVPKDFVNDALKYLEENLQDFKKNWSHLLSAEDIKVDTQPLTWDELCNECKIDFLPPFSKDTKEE